MAGGGRIQLKPRTSITKVESEGSHMSAGKKNAGGETPKSTNRDHIVGRIGADESA